MHWGIRYIGSFHESSHKTPGASAPKPNIFASVLRAAEMEEGLPYVFFLFFQFLSSKERTVGQLLICALIIKTSRNKNGGAKKGLNS